MKKVTIYTSNTCPHCKAAKNYLKENSTINIEMLEVIKKNTYRTYLKMIYFKLLEIIKKNNLKVGDTL